MSLSSDSHSNHSVTLPSGKTVTVNYVHDLPASTSAPAFDPEQHLEICGACSSHLVHPVCWDEAGSNHWEIVLRCPECEWEGTGVFDNLAVERFDEVLEQATEAVIEDLATVERANMIDFADRFLDALYAEQILPEDF